MLGGGPASGKSSLLESGATGTPGRDRAVHVNPDDIKTVLPENPRMTNGPDSDFFHSAGFSHEESSMLAKHIQKVAISKGQDIVLDGTGDSAVEKLAGKVETARQSGYKVVGTYVTIPTEEAWRRSQDRALGDSKRYVPKTVVLETHKAVSDTFDKAVRAGLFDSVTLWDNSERGNPRLVGEGNRKGFKVKDEGLWQAFLSKKEG